MIRPYYKTPFFYKQLRSGEIAVMAQYLATGAIVSATDYALFFTVLKLWNDGLLFATIAGYLGGLIVSYVLSRFWVFKKGAKGQQFKTSALRYGTMLAVNLAITYGMLWAMEAWLGISPLLGKFAVWTFMIFWIYAIEKYWVFKGPRQIKSPF